MDNPELARAYAARAAGHPAQAVEICRKIIAAEPAHQGARSLLAVCFAEAGHVDKARPLIEEAVAAEPDNWRFLLNLSVLREAEGRMNEALDSARSAAERAPERFEAWGRLGDLCGRLGDFEGAVVALEKAVALDHGQPGVALLLAASAYETGRYDLAEGALDRLEKLAPGHPGALRLRTHLARKRYDADAFLTCAERWLRTEPQSEEARVALAHAHAQRDDFHSAVEVYRALVEAHPEHADHAATFAQYLLWSRDFEGAERFYRRALALQPGHAGAATGLARLHQFRGDFAQAEAFARAALRSDPDNVDAYAQLARANGARLTGEELARLEKVADDECVSPERRAIAGFTLGEVLHSWGEHERAFEAWHQANAIKRANAPSYDPAATEALVDRLIASFDASPRGGEVREGPTPIFIVGMPRSGTTLVDSALAAHPQAASGGELPGMPALLTRFFEWADGAGWQGGAIPKAIAEPIRANYLRQYRDYRIPPARFVTDKQPLNFLSVGLIRQVFPAAPIIHILRNPLETGFSIWRNNFTRSWPFSTSLEDIGHYYGQYLRLIEHWRATGGEGMAEVRYETLVDDFEGELRRLLDYIGLDWDPACLRYFEHESIVTTLSSAQVRQAPSKAFVSSTAPYLSHLKPLEHALESAGVCPDAP